MIHLNTIVCDTTAYLQLGSILTAANPFFHDCHRKNTKEEKNNNKIIQN